MQRVDDANAPGPVHAVLKEAVLGLHWDPPPEDARLPPPDLDALCVLLDAQDGLIEVIHPGRLRTADDSVIHTGDALTGASPWDDERIFVFLDALPPSVCTVAFFVVSASGHAFHDVRGAWCHLSDHASGRVWLRKDLTLLEGCLVEAVCTLRRNETDWTVSSDTPTVPVGLVAELGALQVRKDGGDDRNAA